MSKYIFLKWQHMSLQKIFELLLIIAVFALSGNVGGYVISIFIFMIVDADFIKIIQDNAFASSYYFTAKEKLALLCSNFLIYLIIITITSYAININHALFYSIIYSMSSAIIIHLLTKIRTNKYNLMYCFLGIQTGVYVILRVINNVL